VTTRRRLDAELVRRGLAVSRSQAVQFISENKVTVGGAIVSNVSRQVAPSEPIELLGPPPRFVGRGGEKLEAALEQFGIDISGASALDVGASTGGFTDCLLQRGATSVVALDVGHGQLHERLRGDDRVDVLERTNMRHVTRENFGGRGFDIITIDVSFISLTTIAQAVVALMNPGAELVALVKPQFEAGRAEVSKGKGVVSGAGVWSEVLLRTTKTFIDLGLCFQGLMVSPLRGADGNVEFLAWFGRPDDNDLDATVPGGGDDRIASVVSQVVDAVPGVDPGMDMTDSGSATSGSEPMRGQG
jgi:23S rRNA (cytidine1920-2'-O)/16S rRNA (cytidine1409-2'-O)-methyltransferase